MPNEIPYRPSNGTEGDFFMEDFCFHCKKDDYPNGVHCPIIAATMAHKIDDPRYPKEWISDSDGDNPRCTAFEAKDDGT